MAEMTDAEIIAELKREPAAELRRLQNLNLHKKIDNFHYFKGEMEMEQWNA